MGNRDRVFIYPENTFYFLKDIPFLDSGEIYVYVIQNFPQRNIKIGITTDIVQRFKSLSGSNGGGNKIVKLYCSPATWIKSIEKTCHNHYHFARIEGTEWFDGEKLNYEKVVEYVNSLFYSKGYETCNELKRKLIENKNDNKGN